MKVSVGVSNRHVHVTKEHLEILFGHELNFKKAIKQPGQFAAEETVTIKTPKSQIEHVRILGPIRTYTQVEISMTDAYQLGINPPVRDSGDIKGSTPITIIGPNGTVELEEGCIIATRHIHITSKQRELYRLTNIEEVHLKIDGEKGGILNHVLVKESEESYFEVHLDTDDANAFQVNTDMIVTILEGENNDF